MKKIVFISVPVAILLILAGVFLFFRFRYLPMQQVLHVDFSKVDKVSLQYGGTLKETTLTSKGEIQAFFDLFKGVRLRKTGVENNEYSGYTFEAFLYQDGNVLCNFEFGYDVMLVSRPSSDQTVIYKSNTNFNDARIREIAERYFLTKDSQAPPGQG